MYETKNLYQDLRICHFNYTAKRCQNVYQCTFILDLAQDRDGWQTFVNAVMNLQVPQNVKNFLTKCESVSF